MQAQPGHTSTVMRGGTLRFERVAQGVRWIAGGWTIVSAILLWLVSMRLGVVVLPSVFMALGLAVLFSRYSVEIDGALGEVRGSLGWLVPFVAVFRHNVAGGWVAIRLVVTNAKNSTSYSYGVFFVAPNQVRCVMTDDDLARVRATGEAVAKLLDLGVSDEVTGSGFREAGSLDEPLRQRLLRSAGLPPLEPMPARLMAEVLGDELRVRLPRANALPQLGLAISWSVFAGIFWVPLSIVVAGLTHPSLDKGWAFALSVSAALLVSVPAGVVAYRELVALERDVTVFVSPRALGASVDGPFGKRVVMLAADRLESVGVGHRTQLGWFPRLGPNRVIACADDRIIGFGVSCDSEELAWLVRAIHTYLRGA